MVIFDSFGSSKARNFNLHNYKLQAWFPVRVAEPPGATVEALGGFLLATWLEGPHSTWGRCQRLCTFYIMNSTLEEWPASHTTFESLVRYSGRRKAFINYPNLMRHCPSNILFAILLRTGHHFWKVMLVTAIQFILSEFCSNTSVYASFCYCQIQHNSIYKCKCLTKFSSVTVLSHLHNQIDIILLITLYFSFIL